jgi:hypothetical protein
LDQVNLDSACAFLFRGTKENEKLLRRIRPDYNSKVYMLHTNGNIVSLSEIYSVRSTVVSTVEMWENGRAIKNAMPVLGTVLSKLDNTSTSAMRQETIPRKTPQLSLNTFDYKTIVQKAIGHEDSVGLSFSKAHISATRWCIYT